MPDEEGGGGGAAAGGGHGGSGDKGAAGSGGAAASGGAGGRGAGGAGGARAGSGGAGSGGSAGAAGAGAGAGAGGSAGAGSGGHGGAGGASGRGTSGSGGTSGNAGTGGSGGTGGTSGSGGAAVSCGNDDTACALNADVDGYCRNHICTTCTTDSSGTASCAVAYGSEYVCHAGGCAHSLRCASCGGCEIEQPTAASNPHLPDPIDYADPPPTNGPHNACWATWGVHETPVADERWVHNLEHGGVVFLYNCPDGCAADVDALKQLVMARPRTVLTSYSQLPAGSRFAVVSWGHRLVTDCVDTDVFAAFYTANFRHGNEDEGSDPPDTCPP
jgi:hypothetical protein